MAKIAMSDLQTKRLDHLGLVAGMIDYLGIVEATDKAWMPGREKFQSINCLSIFPADSYGFRPWTLPILNVEKPKEYPCDKPYFEIARVYKTKFKD